MLRRFYRVRPLSALLLCLPGLLICLWYSWEAYSAFDRYRRMSGDKVAFGLEDFQLQLFDALRRDVRRMRMPPPPSPSAIKKFDFHVSQENLSRLYESSNLDSGRPYVWVRLQHGGEVIKLELRLRGDQHWHNLGRQKSLKVRLPKGELLDGHRVFNLMNDPSPMVVGEQLILDLAERGGVLTPSSAFARVAINNDDLGVFHYETEPDEGLLRMNRLVPGSLYSGDLPEGAKTGDLWSSAARWTKDASRTEDEIESFADLARLLSNLRSMRVAEFADFARREIDLEAFAAFDALDVAFGGDQHDYRKNNKLAFDPYRGKWRPVAWNFRGFKHDPRFNMVENPILLRLKQVPEYVSIRNRILYGLLVGRCSVSSVRSAGLRILKQLAPELAADRFFDAYKLLPGVSRFHRQMLRPTDLDRAVLVFESEITTYKRRHAFLLAALKKNPLWITDGQAGPGTGGEKAIAFSIVVDGEAGVQLTGLRVTRPPECEGVPWQLFSGPDPVTAPSTRDRADLIRPVDLYPSIGLVPEEKADDKRGAVRTEAVPAIFGLVLKTACAPDRIEAEAIHLATGSRIRSRSAPPELIGRLPAKRLSPGDVPAFTVGEVSPNPPFELSPMPETVRIGPGAVDFPATRVFEAHQTVEVAAGTEIVMGEGASLVFLGRAIFAGTEEEPISISGAAGKGWGGIAVQGPGTAGSSFSHVTATGGTVPRYQMIPYPGMINIHDTEKVDMSHCRFGGNRGSDDLIHAAYVRDLVIDGTEISDPASDAVDLEYSSARLRNLSLLRAGDDGLDLMGSRVKLSDSIIVDCPGNGISAGEESEVRVLDTIIARAKVGVLAKNASEVTLAGSLLYENRNGLRLYREAIWYAGASRIASDVLFVVKSEKTVRTDSDSRDALEVGRIRGRLPGDGSLDHLLEDVLGLDDWEGIDRYLAPLSRGATR